MTIATDVLMRLPADGLPRIKQPQWEIPVRFHNATFLVPGDTGDWSSWKSGPLLTRELKRWVFHNIDHMDESIFLVGEFAEEAAAGLVLDLARQPDGRGRIMHQRYEWLIGWTDTGQIKRAGRDTEIWEWLQQVTILVTALGDPSDRVYNTNQRELLDMRSKRKNRITVAWATPERLQEWGSIPLPFGLPVTPFDAA
jgi:hypothetical protein